jgi:hypothetical protein
MISFFRFLLLSLSDKKQYLEEKGTYLWTYPDTCKEVRLYAVNDFFVEMHTDNEKQVMEIVAFKEQDYLEKYVRQVDLTQLYA